jgi:hypothetical protein
MGPDEEFCAACGANRDAEMKILVLELTQIDGARKWILGIGVWYVVSAFLQIAMQGDWMDPQAKNILIGVSLGLCAVHVGLYLWAKKHTLPAAIVALVLFATLVLVQAVAAPADIWKGVIVKIVFIGVLVKAIQAGYEVHRLRGRK